MAKKQKIPAPRNPYAALPLIRGDKVKVFGDETDGTYTVKNSQMTLYGCMVELERAPINMSKYQFEDSLTLSDVQI